MFTLNTQDELLSIDQLCERLFISPTTAYRLLQTGEIKAFKLGTWKIIKRMCSNHESRVG